MTTYAIKWDEKILVTEENKSSFIWYKFIQENMSEKESMILEYKDTQKQIVSIKSEIQEINDTYETYNEQGKHLADIRGVKLNEKLSQLRQNKDNLVLEWINKYWEEILDDLI